MAFVYLLGDSGQDNTYKIGVTRGKIEKRIKQLQTGNGNEIFLVNSYETKYPFFLERLLHMQFFPQQKMNEWFELKDEDVFNFKEYCTLIEENAKALEDNPFAQKILK
jgi:hypothetical protein